MRSNSIWMEFISLWPFLKVVSLGLYTTKLATVSPFKACCELHCSCLGKCDLAWIMVILFGFCHIHKIMSYGVSSEGILGLFLSFLKVLAHMDITVLLLLTQWQGHKCGRSSTHVQITFQMVWSGWIEIPSMSATCDSSVFGTIPSLASIFICFPHQWVSSALQKVLSIFWKVP